MSVRSRFLIALVAAGLAAQALGASAAPPPDLARAVTDYNDATIHEDIARLSQLVTDDYMLVNSNASVQRKASYLEDFRSPGFTLDPYKIEQPFYRVHGDTAITGWRFHLTWTQDGKRQARFLHIVHSWVKKNGHWQIQYTQLTQVPD